MSIYATLWTIKVEHHFDEWVEITAQAVPPHIGSTDDYGGIDHCAAFLPPPVPEDSDYPRAVVFIAEDTIKGTERSGQEYREPLLVITGKEYVEARFADLMGRLEDAVELRLARVDQET